MQRMLGFALTALKGVVIIPALLSSHEAVLVFDDPLNRSANGATISTGLDTSRHYRR